MFRVFMGLEGKMPLMHFHWKSTLFFMLLFVFVVPSVEASKRPMLCEDVMDVLPWDASAVRSLIQFFEQNKGDQERYIYIQSYLMKAKFKGSLQEFLLNLEYSKVLSDEIFLNFSRNVRALFYLEPSKGLSEEGSKKRRDELLSEVARGEDILEVGEATQEVKNDPTLEFLMNDYLNRFGAILLGRFDLEGMSLKQVLAEASKDSLEALQELWVKGFIGIAEEYETNASDLEFIRDYFLEASYEAEKNPSTEFLVALEFLKTYQKDLYNKLVEEDYFQDESARKKEKTLVENAFTPQLSLGEAELVLDSIQQGFGLHSVEGVKLTIAKIQKDPSEYATLVRAWGNTMEDLFVTVPIVQGNKIKLSQLLDNLLYYSPNSKMIQENRDYIVAMADIAALEFLISQNRKKNTSLN